jgi:hypothetical protein
VEREREGERAGREKKREKGTRESRNHITEPLARNRAESSAKTAKKHPLHLFLCILTHSP